MGVAFEAVRPEVREAHYPDDARRTARENARRKSAWCRRIFPRHFTIAADTAVDFAGRCLAKPRDAVEAAEFLRMLSGSSHVVWTAVALAGPGEEPELAEVSATITFRRLSEKIIRHYIAAVNPIDRAGAYDIAARGGMLIAKCSGSRTAVMGLPKEILREWLERAVLARTRAAPSPVAEPL